jgi:hypothetical protein
MSAMKDYERADSAERRFVRATWAGLSLEREVLFAEIVHDLGTGSLSAIEAEAARRNPLGDLARKKIFGVNLAGPDRPQTGQTDPTTTTPVDTQRDLSAHNET